VRKLLRRAVIGLLLVYLLAVGALFAMQRSMLFPAPQERHAPAAGFAEVTLKTDDGLALQAHWRAPGSGRPVVVYFHGNASSLEASTAATAQLAAAGYGALLVEYRGYGGNPGAPSEEGFYRDGRAAMAFLGAQGIAPARTVVIGNSIGSGTATQMAREFTPAALILSAPFTNVADVAGHQMPWWFPARLLVRDRFDNLAKIGSLEMPVLIQHGTADTVVPYALGRRLAKAAPRATFETYSGAGHSLGLDAPVQAAQLAWLRQQGL
jgi:pimeloyl-ACP methyl ester carboxylesterase